MTNDPIIRTRVVANDCVFNYRIIGQEIEITLGSSWSAGNGIEIIVTEPELRRSITCLQGILASKERKPRSQ